MPVIWITNRIEQIDPAFRRRFQYHLELKSPPPGARLGLVIKALADVAVIPGFADRLAERRGLTPAQIRTAVRFAQLAGGPGDCEKLIERNYEVSEVNEVNEVNEMLAEMERFAGVFICTTNLFEDLDEAALRRFVFKIRFKPLRAEQRERMFAREALDDESALLNPEQRDRLAALDVLTPGDFAAVRQQIDILGEQLTAEEFMAQLEAEHRIKPDVRAWRAIGFRH